MYIQINGWVEWRHADGSWYLRNQVSYLVFPGTSGAPYVDYLLADRHVSGSCIGG